MKINQDNLNEYLDNLKKIIPITIEQNNQLKSEIINFAENSVDNSENKLMLFHVRFFKSFKGDPEIHIHLIGESKKEIIEILKKDFKENFFAFEHFLINELHYINEKPIIWKK